MIDPRQALYDQDYYEHHLGGLAYDRRESHWTRFFGEIAERIVTTIRPNSVFDAGCAHGFLLEALYDRGVRVSGRDISSFAVSRLRSDIRPFVEQGDIAETISGVYDLVTCIEVLEHMPEREAVRAISAMVSVTDLILFSSSPSDLNEPTHINVKPIRWWLYQFSLVHFFPVLNFDASFVTAHAFLLKRSSTATQPATLDAFARLVARRVWHHEIKTWIIRRLAVAKSHLKSSFGKARPVIRLHARIVRFTKNPNL